MNVALSQQQGSVAPTAAAGGPIIEFLVTRFLASRIGITITELLLADSAYVGYNRRTGLVQFEKAGAEFGRLSDALAKSGTILRSEQSGLKVIQLPGEVTATVRPFSTYGTNAISRGYPTIELQAPELTYKFRFKP